MPLYLTRDGCRIAYTRSPALWGRHGTVVYLPGEQRGGRLLFVCMCLRVQQTHVRV